MGWKTCVLVLVSSAACGTHGGNGQNGDGGHGIDGGGGGVIDAPGGGIGDGGGDGGHGGGCGVLPVDAGVYYDAMPDAPPDAAPALCPVAGAADPGAACGTVAQTGCATVTVTCNAPATCGGQGVANVCAIPTATQYCNSGWCFEAPAPISSVPSTTSVVSQTNIWTVGQRGQVRHFDGTAWKEVPVGASVNLHGVWMASATDGWIAGDQGLLLHWNGTTWSAVASGSTANIHAVSGRASNDVYVSGPGVTEHWNGTNWTSVASSTPDMDRMYEGTDIVWGVGESQVWKLANGAWTVPDPNAYADNFAGVIGSSTDAYAIGFDTHIFSGDTGIAYHWDGTAWSVLSNQSGGNPFREAFYDTNIPYTIDEQGVTRLGPGATHIESVYSANLISGGGIGGQAFGVDELGKLWKISSPAVPYGSGTRADLNSISQIGTAMWMVGWSYKTGSVVLTWDRGFKSVTAPGGILDSVSGSAANDVWLLSWDEADAGNRVMHWNGTKWTAQSPTGGITLSALREVGGVPWGVGPGAFRYTAGAWVADSPSTMRTQLGAIAELGGDVYVAGAENPCTGGATAFVAFDHAGTWTTLPAPTSMANVCGISVTAANDIWVAQGSQASHWDGTAWTTSTVVGATALCAIAEAGTDVWASDSSNGTLYHYASNAWTSLPLLGYGTIHSMLVSAGKVWGVGDGGAVVHH